MPRANGTLRFVTANWEPIAFYRVSPKNETEYAGILVRELCTAATAAIHPRVARQETRCLLVAPSLAPTDTSPAATLPAQMDLLPGLLRRANITTPYEIYHTGVRH